MTQALPSLLSSPARSRLIRFVSGPPDLVKATISERDAILPINPRGLRSIIQSAKHAIKVSIRARSFHGRQSTLKIGQRITWAAMITPGHRDVEPDGPAVVYDHKHTVLAPYLDVPLRNI